MTKQKITDEGNIVVYSKKPIEFGDEADIADELLTEAIIGYKTFASHLKEDARKDFWKEIEAFVQSAITTAKESLG